MAGPFIKQVLEAFNNPKKYVARPLVHDEAPAAVSKIVLKHDAQQRALLRKATKFSLDKEFTSFSGTVSMQLSAEDALNCFWKAKTPYPIMWVEWDERARVDGLIKGGEAVPKDDNLPEVAGMLFQPVDDSENIQMATLYIPDDLIPKGIFEFPIKIIWTSEPDQAGLKELELRTRIKEDGGRFFSTDDGRQTGSGEIIGQVCLVGADWLKKVFPELQDGMTVEEQEGYLEMLERAPDNVRTIIQATSMGITGSGRYLLDAVGRLRGWEKQNDLINQSLTEMSGDVRWIVTFLSMLNSFENFMGPSEFLSGTRLGMHSKSHRKFMEFRTLGIKLPRQKRFVTVQRRLAAGLPRRAHLVRGFYRTRRNGVLLPREQWSWVRSHQRGDASLGFIYKDYNVEMGDN